MSGLGQPRRRLGSVKTDTGDTIRLHRLARGDLTLTLRDEDGMGIPSVTLWPHEAECLRDQLNEYLKKEEEP